MEFSMFFAKLCLSASFNPACHFLNSRIRAKRTFIIQCRDVKEIENHFVEAITRAGDSPNNIQQRHYLRWSRSNHIKVIRGIISTIIVDSLIASRA